MTTNKKIRKVILDGTHGCGKTTITRKYIGLERFGIFSLDEAVRTLSAFPQYCFQPTNIQKYSFSEAVLIGHKAAQAKALELSYNAKFIVEDRSIVGPLIYSSYFNAQAELKDYNWERRDPIRNISLKEYAHDMINDVRKIGWFDDAIVYLLEPLHIDFNATDDKFRIMAHCEENLTDEQRKAKQEQGTKIQFEVFEEAKKIYSYLGIPYIVCSANQCNKEVESMAREVIISQLRDVSNPNHQYSPDYEELMDEVWKNHLEEASFKFSEDKFVKFCIDNKIEPRSERWYELKGYYKKCHEMERGIF